MCVREHETSFAGRNGRGKGETREKRHEQRQGEKGAMSRRRTENNVKHQEITLGLDVYKGFGEPPPSAEAKGWPEAPPASAEACGGQLGQSRPPKAHATILSGPAAGMHSHFCPEGQKWLQARAQVSWCGCIEASLNAASVSPGAGPFESAKLLYFYPQSSTHLSERQPETWMC